MSISKLFFALGVKVAEGLGRDNSSFFRRDALEVWLFLDKAL
jgi:hypothetical protein